MLFQRESRGVEAFDFVAVFATIKVRGAHELLRVRIFVAIGTCLRCRVIVCIETGSSMALGTLQTLVLARQRVLGRLMAGFGESCGLPTCIRMTGAAFAVIGAAHELPLVLVLMAIHALLVLDRLLEIGVHVTLVARQTFMLTVQRELGFTVVEIAAGDVHPFPSPGVVTRLAPRLERTVMGILMAGGARGEINAFILNDFRIQLARLVTLGALDVFVLAGQREVGSGVIKFLDRFPVVEVMAGLTFGAQLPGVMILVAGETGRVESLEGLRQVVHHDVLAIGGRNVFRVMALLTFQLCMLTDQRVTGLLVIELFFGRLPLEDAKPFAVVLGVAASAIGVTLGMVGHASVHTLVVFHQLVDFAMAVQALELGFSGAEAMAHRTL